MAEPVSPPVPLVPQGWQPISTAPKHKRVLIWSDKSGVIGIYRWGDYERYNEGKFTHWMPLPDPPLQSLVPDPEEDTKVHHSRALFDALERSPHARREPLTMTMPPNKWEYRIRAYLPPNQGGGLAIETVHVGTASRDMEIAAFKARMARGEISCIEVVAHVEPFGTERIYSTDPH